MGTKFTVYDNGLNPMKSTTSVEASNLRQELAAICYVSWSKHIFSKSYTQVFTLLKTYVIILALLEICCICQFK